MKDVSGVQCQTCPTSARLFHRGEVGLVRTQFPLPEARGELA